MQPDDARHLSKFFFSSGAALAIIGLLGVTILILASLTAATDIRAIRAGTFFNIVILAISGVFFIAAAAFWFSALGE